MTKTAAAPVKTPVTEPPQFQILSDVAIPERASFPRGPRGSIYPLEKLVKGQCFDVPVSSDKEAAQKRSYLSALGKSRGIKVVTRYLVDETGQNYFVRCWHAGEREVVEAEPAAEGQLEAAE